MEIDNHQVPCTPYEYFDGVEDKCVPCENICTREPLTFCKNNCPEFYKKLTAAANISNADPTRTTFVDHLFLSSPATEPPLTAISRSPSQIEVIHLTTLVALIAAFIAICIAVVAFILIYTARRRARSDTRSSDTENPLLPGTESSSLCKSNFGDSSSKGNSLNGQTENFSTESSLVCSHSNPPDVARDAKATGDENTHTPGSSSGYSKDRTRHTWNTNDGEVCDVASAAEQPVKRLNSL